MRTLENASFAEPLRLVARTALPAMAFCLLVTADAEAQQPFGPQPPPGQFQPQPGRSSRRRGSSSRNRASSSRRPDSSSRSPASSSRSRRPGSSSRLQDRARCLQDRVRRRRSCRPPARRPRTEPPKVDDVEERARTLLEQPNTFGSTGLLRTSFAGSGAAGTFRVVVRHRLVFDLQRVSL